MARKLLKRWSPDPSRIKQLPALGFLGKLIHDPNLFHLNRHSVSVAVAVGLFVAFVPTVGQMALAALLALWLRCNLPISVALCWVSNPVTIPPLFYATYELGCWILQVPKMNFAIELSWDWLNNELLAIWKPLLVGSLLTGIFLAAFGYLAMQAFWYWHVMHHWELRRKRRVNRK